MSLLGIDVGTTGCKAAAFSVGGQLLSLAYSEYDIRRPEPHQAELDAPAVWELIKRTIRRAVEPVKSTDPVRALSTSSMGEAFVPVGADRTIIGPSILINDARGTEFVEQLRARMGDEECYRLTGNPVTSQYGLPKLMWLREHERALYDSAKVFLNWGSLVGYLLGADAAVDYSLANRDLLFDLERLDWSDRLLALAGIERAKLPRCVPSGTPIGTVSEHVATELGLSPATLVVSGAHDQCANALGCGVTEPGTAMYGMGTFPTIAPVFVGTRDPKLMVRFGLNTEHHALPDRYVSFLYHMGGSIVKWYRDTFALAEHRAARERGDDVYPALFAELPCEPGPVLVLPHFTPMGPPDFVSDSCGVVVGLHTDTTRGEILKGIVEANCFALKVSVDNLANVDIVVDRYTAVGGGSRSDAVVQISADIMDAPFVRPRITEAGAFGAALMAGMGNGDYRSGREAARSVVEIEREFEPNASNAARYRELYERYTELSTTIGEFARGWSAFRERR